MYRVEKYLTYRKKKKHRIYDVCGRESLSRHSETL